MPQNASIDPATATAAIIADIAALGPESFRNILSHSIDRTIGRTDGEDMGIVPDLPTLTTTPGIGEELEFTISGTLKAAGAADLEVDVHGTVGTYQDDVVVLYRGVVEKGVGFRLLLAA